MLLLVPQLKKGPVPAKREDSEACPVLATLFRGSTFIDLRFFFLRPLTLGEGM